MNENDESTKYGECRCCSSIGQHRDLTLEYEWNGTKEVYFKTFLECFNLFVSILYELFFVFSTYYFSNLFRIL